jgi:hypothetical protein
VWVIGKRVARGKGDEISLTLLNLKLIYNDPPAAKQEYADGELAVR